MIFSLPDDYKRGVADFLSHFDRDADISDLMKSVKYELGVYEDYYDDDTAGGIYDYKNGLILISKDIKSGYDTGQYLLMSLVIFFIGKCWMKILKCNIMNRTYHFQSLWSVNILPPS